MFRVRFNRPMCRPWACCRGVRRCGAHQRLRDSVVYRAGMDRFRGRQGEAGVGSDQLPCLRRHSRTRRPSGYELVKQR
jgi:hypothetical protein